MTRRPAVTLIEVLMAMFIMAIGMLALLVLFPLGAVSMGQALKDDRAASTASMAENVAIAMNVRHDSLVETAFGNGVLVYVDPFGAQQGLPPIGGVIPRTAPSFAQTLPLANRWFSLPDDIGFNKSGTADTSNTGGFIDRGRRYSYAYLLKRLQPGLDDMVQLYVVVYSGRPIGVLGPEPTVAGSITSSNSIQLGMSGTPIKIGGWILDTGGNFYRVSNLADAGGATTIETQQPVQGTVGSPIGVVILDAVVEVFDKGTSWQP